MLTLLAAVRVFFRSRSDTALEILALRQQVAVLKRKRPRPCLNSFDRLFWTALQRLWSRWTDVLVIVKPETVIGWHRAGFRLYWRWRSRTGGGRPKISDEMRVLIRRAPEGRVRVHHPVAVTTCPTSPFVDNDEGALRANQVFLCINSSWNGGLELVRRPLGRCFGGVL